MIAAPRQIQNLCFKAPAHQSVSEGALTSAHEQNVISLTPPALEMARLVGLAANPETNGPCLGAPPCRCDTVTMPSCHIRRDRHLSRAGCAPWLEMFSSDPSPSWQVLPVLLEMRTGDVCCLVGLAVSSPHSPHFEEMWESCWCHALGYPWVKSRSACCLAGLPHQPQ